MSFDADVLFCFDNTVDLTVVLDRFVILSLLYDQRIPDLSFLQKVIPAKGVFQKLFAL